MSTLTAMGALGLAGCASPGVPRSPSLDLPGAVTDLTAVRRGGAVELRFTMPMRNTDKLPIRAATISVSFCRAVDSGACLAAPGTTSFARVTNGRATVATLRDALPEALVAGQPRVLEYRVELSNALGKTAGYSDAVYTAAGKAPAAVEGLTAEGSRLGVVLRWKPAAADGSAVVLRREDLTPRRAAEAVVIPTTEVKGKKAVPVTARKRGEEEPGVVWLAAGEGDRVLDADALAEEPYRYAAERRRTVQLGGRALELRSEVSAGVGFALHDVFPPPAPTDLSAAVFAVSKDDAGAGVAVDLIWQPVEDAGLAGYVVYRQSADEAGMGKRVNAEPVRLPAFHDVIAGAIGGRVRYSVTAVDLKGNESAAAVTVVAVGQ